MSSSLKFIASLTLSFGLYICTMQLVYLRKWLGIFVLHLWWTVFWRLCVLFICLLTVHIDNWRSAESFFQQLKQVKGKAVLHFLQERYVVTFSTPSAGQETVLSWLSISCSSFLCFDICVCAIADWRFSRMYLLSWTFLTIALVKL